MTATQTPAARVATVLAGLGDVRGWQEEFYRDLHRHPELSGQERRTAQRVADRLRTAGFEVHEEVGGTGVVGILRNGEGPTVLLRAEMDALPVREATGLPYASTATATGPDGDDVPVMHACGHDLHVSCLLGAAQLLADGRQAWRGSLVTVFQPAEETGEGARSMLDDGLAALIPTPDVALAQHVLPFPAGVVGTHPGPMFAAADSLRVTVHGRGGHGSAPQTTVDPVVLAAAIVLRLHTVVGREIQPGRTAVLTVGSLHAGTTSNVIPDSAELRINIRSYDDGTRTAMLDAIRRIVIGECTASGSPRDPEFELYDRFPVTDNDEATTARVAEAFTSFFGDRAVPIPQLPASEDFGEIPTALGVPYTYWAIGGTDPGAFGAAEQAGRLNQEIPVNHAATFAPVVHPTVDTGTQALVVAALAWL